MKTLSIKILKNERKYDTLQEQRKLLGEWSVFYPEKEENKWNTW